MKLVLAFIFLLATGLTDVLGEVFFEERFLQGSIDNWTPSKVDLEKLGKAEFVKCEPAIDDEEDGGLNTTEPARFYRLSAPLKNTLNNKEKNMCVQFTVKYPQGAECVGAYVKLIGEDFNQDEFNGETPYEIMFGPDVCGFETRLVHVIFSHEGKNHLIKERIPFKVDNMTHLFRLNIFPNNSFSVFVDQELRRNGTLVDEFSMIKPREIDDPEDKKPEDWVDEVYIPDPDDKKPDDWDQPETIVDTSATKPDDWNDDTDGEWTAPMIRNPEFKGEWHQKSIPNPAYKGSWAPRKIPNPEFVDDPTLYERKIKYIGLDLWQVQSGTIFDNFIVSDDLNECDEHIKYWKKRHDVEEEVRRDREEAGDDTSEETDDEEGSGSGPTIQTSTNFDQVMEETKEREQERLDETEEDEKKRHEEL
nr:calreticulin [Hymenolepis microstoma]CDS34483.1 calreticulin [Hymenolepis microstoma]